MTVYVEYVIIDNLAIDWLLLWAAARTCRCYKNWYRTALGAAFGTAFAVFMPFLDLPNALLFIIKIMVGEVMVLLSASFKTAGGFIATFLTFLAYTFCAGGAMIGICYMLGADFSTEEGLAALSRITNINIGIVLIGVILTVSLLVTLFGGAKRREDFDSFTRKIEIVDGGGKAELAGLIDTGNSLYDNRSGKPVSVMGKDVAERLFGEGKLRMHGAHYVRCSTVHGSGKILVFEIEKMMIYCGKKRHIINNAMMGISSDSLQDGTDVILHAGLG